MIFRNEIIGGILIGFASALPLLWDGRIAGVSGYASSSLRAFSDDGKTSFLFIIGLIAGGLLWRFSGNDLPLIQSQPMLVWAFSGLCVGFGSRYGGGCTSGHGICGLGRFSLRSLFAVIIFMSTAILVRLLIKAYL